MIKQLANIFRARGPAGVLRAVHSYLQRLTAKQSKSFREHEGLFVAKLGLEIGGPSRVFTKRGVFPVYPLARSIDNCNFSSVTLWERGTKPGKTFRFEPKKAPGHQYVREATALDCLASGAYDFLLSSHVLEHIANPILALREWARLLKSQGILVLLVPNKSKTFDHKRAVTTLEHIVEDFRAAVTEDDLTHVEEILALHDLKRDPEAGDYNSFKQRSVRNLENRSLHHHVFDEDLLAQAVEYVGLKVLQVERLRPHHILLLAKKTDEGASAPQVR